MGSYGKGYYQERDWYEGYTVNTEQYNHLWRAVVLYGESEIYHTAWRLSRVIVVGDAYDWIREQGGIT